MATKQPAKPIGQPPKLTPPLEEENLIVYYGDDHLTPEQKKYPVWRIPGQRPLHELVPAHRLPPNYQHPDYKPESAGVLAPPSETVEKSK